MMENQKFSSAGLMELMFGSIRIKAISTFRPQKSPTCIALPEILQIMIMMASRTLYYEISTFTRIGYIGGKEAQMEQRLKKRVSSCQLMDSFLNSTSANGARIEFRINYFC